MQIIFLYFVHSCDLKGEADESIIASIYLTFSIHYPLKNGMKQLTISEAQSLTENILYQHGFSAAQVAAMTQTIMAAQIDDCNSHGLYRILGCVATAKAGKACVSATPEVHDQAPAIVKVDAKGGFAPLAFQMGLPMLLDKARQNGIAALAINHCVHFSALWVEIEQIVQAGLVALACNPAHAWVTPHGGSKPVLGTNPIAFGFPRLEKDPYIFDFATSAIARGDIELHRRENKPIPQGWGVDAQGNPSLDAAEVLDHGAMLTFGTHKGTALSTMIELIAGPLIGDLTSKASLEFDGGTHSLPHHGELIIALAPERFLGDMTQYYLQQAEHLFDDIEHSGARLPSVRRYKARKNNIKNGTVKISKGLYQDLCALNLNKQ